MNLLLDTHTVLWLACNSPKLSGLAKELILSDRNQCYVSIASAWEVSIKVSLNSDLIVGGVREFFRIIDSNGFKVLPITSSALETVEKLPFHHRDPFDRLLVSSALAHDLTIVSADRNVYLYGAKWAW